MVLVAVVADAWARQLKIKPSLQPEAHQLSLVSRYYRSFHVGALRVKRLLNLGLDLVQVEVEDFVFGNVPAGLQKSHEAHNTLYVD